MSFIKNDRVTTPQGMGTIAYRRMKAPDYAEVDVYSVCLDSKTLEAHHAYSGTIFPAEQVRAI